MVRVIGGCVILLQVQMGSESLTYVFLIMYYLSLSSTCRYNLSKMYYHALISIKTRRTVLETDNKSESLYIAADQHVASDSRQIASSPILHFRSVLS